MANMTPSVSATTTTTGALNSPSVPPLNGTKSISKSSTPISNTINGNTSISINQNTNSSNANGTVSSPAQSSNTNSGKRLDLESLIKEFQKKLGKNWDKYQESLSLFLVGKLSRKELIDDITPILEGGLIKYHNKLLLINLVNSYNDSSGELSNDFSSFWNKKTIKSKGVRSSQYERFKQNIMGLPVRERKRIKSITRESGKKGMVNASIVLTRQAMLPKIPQMADKSSPLNHPTQWQTDVINGIQAPLSTEIFELPENDNLAARVCMIMREHGLIGALKPEILDIMQLGLETHLKNLVESAIDVTTYRKTKYDNDELFVAEPIKEDAPPIKRRKITITAEDMYNTLEVFPHLVEPGGPSLRLSNVMLKNDDLSKDNDYFLPPKIELLSDPEQRANTRPSGKNNTQINGTSNGGIDSNNSVDNINNDKSKIQSIDTNSNNHSHNISTSTSTSTSTSNDNNINHINNKNTIGNSNNNSKPVETPKSSITENTIDLKYLLHDILSHN